jgi:hypothetical protein
MIRLFGSLMALGLDSIAGATLPDKSQYNLFNPTPRELMREMTTDRPDTTESAYTVDAGHLQIELSFIDYVHEDGIDSFSVMPTNFRLGVLNNLEFAIVVEPYLNIESADMGAITSDSGFGNIQVRSKLSLWGNDGGRTALSLMPFVTLPTASSLHSHDHVEFGLIIPFAISLDDEWGLGMMAEFDAVFDQTRDQYDLEFIHTTAIGRDIIGDLGAYVEYIGIAFSAPGSDYQAALGLGLTYAFTPDLQLDAGMNIGLNDAAEDLNPFVGMSIRF